MFSRFFSFFRSNDNFRNDDKKILLVSLFLSRLANNNSRDARILDEFLQVNSSSIRKHINNLFLRRTYSEGNKDFLFDESLSTSSGLDFTIRYSKIGRIDLLPNIGLLYRLSDGQWHTNSDELMRNSSIIASKFETYFGLDLARRHLDYFYWIEVRKHGYSYFSRKVLSNLLHLRIPRLKMLYWLLSRNVQALIQGRLQQSFVQNEIQKLNS